MDYITAKERAIKFIGISKKTRQEVVRKLKSLDIEEDIVQKVVNSLEEIGYIDDIAYLHSYLKECDKMRKYSIYEIKQKLLQKGIKKSIINTEIVELEENNYEKEVMERIISSKSKSMDEMKLKRYLYSRGFKVSNESECF